MNKLAVKPSSGTLSANGILRQFGPAADRIYAKDKRRNQREFDSNTQSFDNIMSRMGIDTPERTKRSMRNKIAVPIGPQAQSRLNTLRALPQGMNLREVATGSAKGPDLRGNALKSTPAKTNIKGARVNKLATINKEAIGGRAISNLFQAGADAVPGSTRGLHLGNILKRLGWRANHGSVQSLGASIGRRMADGGQLSDMMRSNIRRMNPDMFSNTIRGHSYVSGGVPRFDHAGNTTNMFRRLGTRG